MTNKKKLILIFIILGIATRLIPHPPNFTSLLAIALFSGAFLEKKYLAAGIPLIIMFISDLILNLPITFSVYVSFILITLIGKYLKNKQSSRNIIKYSIFSSLLFFIITNLSVFIYSGMYTKDFVGLAKCYIVALPFFLNTLISTITYSFIVFYSFKLTYKKILYKL